MPDGYQWVTWVNPLAPLLDGGWPGAELFASGGLAVIALVIGWVTFRRLEDASADVV